MKEKLQALYRLQQVDSAIELLKKQYANLDVGKAEQAAYEATQIAYQEAEEALQAVRTTLKDIELERQSVEAKRKDYEKRLYSGTVTAMRELQGMEMEVEALGRRCAALDAQILSLLAETEIHQQREAQAKQEVNDAAAALRAKRTAAKLEAERLQNLARGLAMQRATAQKEVATELLPRYEALRTSKSGVAIVRIVEGTACGGCRLGLPSSIVKQVEAGTTLVYCDNCRRLLCDVEE